MAHSCRLLLARRMTVVPCKADTMQGERPAALDPEQPDSRLDLGRYVAVLMSWGQHRDRMHESRNQALLPRLIILARKSEVAAGHLCGERYRSSP